MTIRSSLVHAFRDGRRHRHLRRGVAVAAAVVLLSSGAAAASVVISATTSTTIRGCVNNTSRVLTDLKASTVNCPAGTSKVNWNATGPKGAKGPKGAPGAKGATGPSASYMTTESDNPIRSTFTTEASLNLPAGSFTFDASVWVSDISGEQDYVFCDITADGNDVDGGAAMLTTAIGTADYETISLVGAESKALAGKAIVQCDDHNSTGQIGQVSFLATATGSATFQPASSSKS
jgi:hypothetical protein